MKIGKITKTSAQGIEESTIEVDGWKILTGLLSAGLITGLIAGLTFFLIDLPKSNFEKEKELRNEKFEIFNFVLRAKSDTIRRNSQLFMLKSGALTDDNETLLKIVQDGLIPDWSEMPDFEINNSYVPFVPIPSNDDREEVKPPTIGIQKE